MVFRIVIVLLGLVPFIVFEAGLRVFGVARRADAPDALAGFAKNYPLFERQGDMYRTLRGREPFFSPQEFPVAKPTNGFRIFCFGGSTVYGHPYEWPTAFPKWLEMELAAADPARSYQAVNCGGVSYASYRLAPIVREVLDYKPDLIVLATGHNEFLEDRTYHSIKARSKLRAWIEDAANSLRIVNLARSWLAAPNAAAGNPDTGMSPEVRTRLDDRSGYASYHRDDAWRARVTAQFEESVRAMVTMCRDAKVPVLLVKLGSNLRDCPPFKSEHRPGLGEEHEAAWQARFDSASGFDDRSPVRALEIYRQAEAIDDEHALLSWRIARALDRLGRAPEAAVYYLRAKELDVCPLRLIRANEENLSRIASETGTPLVDAAAIFISLSPDGLAGNSWYVDHVHPNIGGHQRIARAIAAAAAQAKIVPRGPSWPEEERRAAYARHLDSLGPTYFPNGRRRVEWLENWARRERLLSETTPKDARGHLHLGMRRLDLGDEEGAWQAFADAARLDADMPRQLAEHAAELEAQGRPQAADSLRGKLAGLKTVGK